MRFAGKFVLLAIVASSFATAQESASITGPDIVKAGEPLDLKVTLDQAPNFDGGGVQITIVGPDGFTIQSGCNPKAGEKVCHWIYTLPADSKGGIWFVSSLVFNSGTHQITLPFQKLTFNVLPRTDLIFPTKAEIEVSPSQIQLLRREVARLQTQLQILKASVAGESLTDRVVKELTGKITAELSYVKKTESAFQEMGKKEQSEATHIFFDDIRVGYSDVLADLSTKPLAETKSKIISVAWPPQGKTGKGKRYPLAAQVVFGAFELNQRAYTLVADTQSLIFNLEVNSNPEGATISYRRRGDSYKPHPSPTNSILKALPYAIWTIRFEKQGFREQEIDFNPFVDSNHVVNANLTK